MAWMLPAQVANLAGALVLAAIYAYLYRLERERCVLLWTWGWVTHGLRYLFGIWMLASPSAPALEASYQVAASAGGLLLVCGTLAYLGRGFPRSICCWSTSSCPV